jgi:RNA polymerase sigma-70 factor (ECF subfamily)
MSKILPFNNDRQQSSAPELKTLFARYYDRLLYFAWQYVHDKETARDLIQDAFITYWHKANEVSVEETQIRNYLYVNVRNACLKHIRHVEVAGKYQDTLKPEPAEEAQGADRIIRAEVIGEIYRVIDSLPEPYRRISRMSYIEGLKNQEIADQTGVPLNTVKSQKQKALQLIRLKVHPETYVALLLMSKLLR